MPLALRLSLSLLFAGAVLAQPARVLVIFNSHASFPGSLEVAQHYQAQRSIPAANRCGISFPNEVQITEAAWLSTYRTAVRACIDSVGRANVLYIVMSYQTPFRIVPTGKPGASLDSYIADAWDAHSATYFPPTPASAHRYAMQAQTMGNVYPAFLSFASFRAQPRAPLFYSVWRLDGASTAVAKGLVDKAISAENAGGLTGTVYADRRSDDDNRIDTNGDAGSYTGDHDLRRLANMARLTNLPVVEDFTDAEIGTAPAPLTAPNAALYSGWYSLTYNANDPFTWVTGAIGFHLDSASLTNPRGGSSWSAQALQRGITVTSGSVEEPFLQGLPQPDVVYRHLFQGGNVGDAFLRGTQWLKWMNVNVGDPLYRPFPLGKAPFDAVFPEASLSITPQQVVSGNPVQLLLTLVSPAPSGGATYTLTGRGVGSYMILPTSITVAGGSRTASLTIPTNPIPTDWVVPTITVSGPGVNLTNSFSSFSLLSRVAVADTVKGGSPAQTGFAIINSVARFGGVPITLSSSNPAVLAISPTSVTVAFGAQAAAFSYSTMAVAVPTVVTITATSGVYSSTTTVTVTP